MNTANKLTMARVVMIPVFLVLLYLDFKGHLYAALAVFILASVTDFIDGYVARHYNMITDFGKFMDPLADKLLVFSAMAWFVEMAWMPAWARASLTPAPFALTWMISDFMDRPPQTFFLGLLYRIRWVDARNTELRCAGKCVPQARKAKPRISRRSGVSCWH